MFSLKVSVHVGSSRSRMKSCRTSLSSHISAIRSLPHSLLLPSSLFPSLFMFFFFSSPFSFLFFAWVLLPHGFCCPRPWALWPLTVSVHDLVSCSFLLWFFGLFFILLSSLLSLFLCMGIWALFFPVLLDGFCCPLGFLCPFFGFFFALLSVLVLFRWVLLRSTHSL